MTIFGECIVLTTNYHLFCFTDWTPDPLARYTMGKSLIVTTLFGIAIYLLVILWDPVAVLFRQLKLRFIRMVRRAKRKEAKPVTVKPPV
jgi:hypothetical protein